VEKTRAIQRERFTDELFYGMLYEPQTGAEFCMVGKEECETLEDGDD